MTATPDELLTPKGVAKILGIDEHTLYRWRRDNKFLPFYKLGDGPHPPIRYRRSEVLRFLSSGRVEIEDDIEDGR